MAKLFGLIKHISLGRLLLLLSALALVLSFSLIFGLSGALREHAVHTLAREDAQQTSKLVFQSLYSAMRKGWNKEEINTSIARLNEAMPSMQIRVWRSPAVAAQFGEMPGERQKITQDSELQAAFSDGKDHLTYPSASAIRYLYPVRAQQECLTCHTQSQVGAIHGVIDVTYPITQLKVSFDTVLNTIVGYTLLIIALSFLALYFKLRKLVAQPLVELVGVIQAMMQNMDFSRRVKGGHLITELRRLTEYFNHLLAAMQDYNRQLEEISIRDPLTGLYNRRKFEEFLEYETDRARRHNHPFSLIMIDLDDFKFINDTYGHPVGDLALKTLTAMLEGSLRKCDLMARLGGDEFAIILPETPSANGLQVAKKLHDIMRVQPVKLPVGDITLSASFSVVNYPNDGENIKSLLTAMDVLLYKAKRSGKNQVLTSQEDDDNSAMVIFQQGEFLRQALTDGRVEAYLQPIVRVADGHIMAYEALARIRDGERVLSAGQFIEAASELGMVKEFDQRVFDKGLQHIPAITKNTPDAKVFFNLSAFSFRDTDWMLSIPAQLRARGISCGQVVLEVTEREALPNINAVRNIIETLRAQGLQFALDDFGSGFSSFLYLKYLPVDYLKIEGSFVQHMLADDRDRIMVRHIHQVAQEFGMKSIAEFVEDEATAKILAEIGVCCAQGYYFGMPRDIPEPPLYVIYICLRAVEDEGKRAIIRPTSHPITPHKQQHD
jgi:diguanylate cyclase (GGDEF)-like protein